MTERYEDMRGRPIQVGTRVVGCGPDDMGSITAISDPDGDVNEYGETVGIAPRMRIKWDDGSMEWYQFHSTVTGPWDADDAPWRCDDVEALA